jgi:hypothetical protein
MTPGCQFTHLVDSEAMGSIPVAENIHFLAFLCELLVDGGLLVPPLVNLPWLRQ